MVLDFYKKIKEGLLYNSEPESWIYLEEYTILDKIINAFFYSDFEKLINYLKSRYPVMSLEDIVLSVKDYLVFILSNDEDIHRYYDVKF